MTQPVEEARSAAENKVEKRTRPQVMMCPFTNHTNRYIQIQKDLYRSIGYDVVPLSIKGLLKGGFFQLFKAENILAFHWLEYRPFKREKGTARLSPTGSLLFAFYCLLMVIGRAKVVYFMHDHAVHDTVGFNRRLSIRIIAFVRRPTTRQAAVAIDERFALKEKFSTALYIRNATSDPFQRLGPRLNGGASGNWNGKRAGEVSTRI